jgi:hypothetical protein
MLDKLKQIWNDAVFSKVIAVGLAALIAFGYSLIPTTAKKSFKNEMMAFWTKKIELWLLLLLILFGLTVYLLIKKFKNFKYEIETLKLDKELFSQIRESYLTEEMMLAPKNFSFSSNPFLIDSLTNLFKISEENIKSNFEFINPLLEKRKQKLIKELNKLYEITSTYIFGTINSGYLSIPSEWEFNDPERMQEAVSNISKQEKQLSETYDDFIKTGRRILKV